MDLDRIYAYRFRDVDRNKRSMVWQELAIFLDRELGGPNVLLDPAAAMCEYINAAPSKEKWAVDLNEPFIRAHAVRGLKIVIGDSLSVDLPKDHFDGIFVSNRRVPAAVPSETQMEFPGALAVLRSAKNTLLSIAIADVTVLA